MKNKQHERLKITLGPLVIFFSFPPYFPFPFDRPLIFLKKNDRPLMGTASSPRAAALHPSSSGLRRKRHLLLPVARTTNDDRQHHGTSYRRDHQHHRLPCTAVRRSSVPPPPASVARDASPPRPHRATSRLPAKQPQSVPPQSPSAARRHHPLAHPV